MAVDQINLDSVLKYNSKEKDNFAESLPNRLISNFSLCSLNNNLASARYQDPQKIL